MTNFILLPLLIFALTGVTRPPTSNYYIPFVGHKDIASNRTTARLGVAAGWQFTEEESDILNVSMYHNWSMDSTIYWANDLQYFNTFWSNCIPSDEQCDNNYLNDVFAFCNGGFVSSSKKYVMWDGSPVIGFLNEPENPDQANDTINQAVYYFKYIKDTCGSQVALTTPMLTFPKCWFPPDSHPHLQYLTAKYGQESPYCWLREFITVYRNTYGELPDIEILAIHAHHSVGWVSYVAYKPTLRSMYNDMYSVYESFYGSSYKPPMMITEFSSCDPAYISSIINELKYMPEVIGILGWVPNMPDDYQHGLCTRYFAPYGSMQLTPVGCAFARREDC